ncbi:FHA domain-containing protein [Bifidobacterium gallicum]|uniref:FHA domain-containing protein n=1 Tax=Bifidobacterium gallicum TaxID=78342 RepID=UPI0002DC18A1|nr:FHA domain-containing protein [Bifidobacterium gallicum]
MQDSFVDHSASAAGFNTAAENPAAENAFVQNSAADAYAADTYAANAYADPAVSDDHDDVDEGEPLEYTAEEGATGSEEWDGTVLSSVFMPDETPQTVYQMTNPATGQQIVVDMGVLMGRKPSQDIPQGAKAVRLIDPTRTVSRNHAAISFDQDGSLWIEDYGSLNGTFIIDDEGEHKVQQGTPVQLVPPVKVRIGDQIFDFDRK